MRPGTGASGIEPERSGFGDPTAWPQARPSEFGVTGGTRTRAAGITTPNAARYTTVTVASAGVEPAWRRRMKPAEPPGLCSPSNGYARLDSNQRPSAVAGRCSSVLSYGRASGKGRSRTATAEKRPGYSRLGSPVPGAFPGRLCGVGTPGRTRTCGFRVRSAALCSS